MSGLDSYSDLVHPQESHHFRRSGLSGSPTVQNGYLNFSAVGEFLQHLSRSTCLKAHRKLPAGLVLGQPNLLVVTDNEVLPTLLGLYMCDHSNLAMPAAQEILWCSAKTTAEEVITFWQRAILDEYGRIFSFVGANSLSFEIGRQTVCELLRLCTSDCEEQVRNFRLVIICSRRDGHQLSPVASYLNEYRRSTPRCPSEADIQLYLKHRLLREIQPTQRKLPAVSSALLHGDNGEIYCVQAITSRRSGAGKSTFVELSAERMSGGNMHNSSGTRGGSLGEEQRPYYIVMPLHEKSVEVDTFVAEIRERCKPIGIRRPKIVHIDVSPLVRQGLDRFLFSLVVLGQVIDSSGRVWRRYETDYYVIEWSETTRPIAGSGNSCGTTGRTPFISYLPCIHCNSPTEFLKGLQLGRVTTIPIHMTRLFESEIFQRAVQYLNRRNTDIGTYRYNGERTTNHALSLETVVNHCATNTDDPSWADVKHYVSFLSYQLQSMDDCDFCTPASLEVLRGFKNFVLEFMIRMSRDFSEPSLNVKKKAGEIGSSELAQHQLCRTWEKSEHPYLFFNKDRHTFSFVGIVIEEDGHMKDPANKIRDLGQVMTATLRGDLKVQGCNLEEDYRSWDRGKRMSILGSVMGVTNHSSCDDPSYELTNDNMMKLLAIEMRFQCGIPVVLLGETGCGKTRLIQFMCKLKAGLKQEQNLVMKKIHGGVTRREILLTVEAAERMAIENYERRGTRTVLFFDEANTTEHIGLIKEIICDRRMNGRLVKAIGESLQVVAACNPYRCHRPDMIRRLEAAGLGYAVKGSETSQMFGDTPLRHLVYRVQPLPESMQRLVWDFGQLKPETEKLYIEQLVKRFLEFNMPMYDNQPLLQQLTDVLAASQAFMRSKTDECSFVSIRDVERTLEVAKWFHAKHGILGPLLDNARSTFRGYYWKQTQRQVSALATAIVLALGVCYHARLHDRGPYRERVYDILRSAPLSIPGGSEAIESEIRLCQEVFLDQLQLPPGVGRNQALCENVFMMIVCINLRIPLFLVGKPGSSKNLAKDIIKAAMRDKSNPSTLFRELKEVHMLSYQCSKKSTAAGIIDLFQRCEQVQETHDSNAFAACAVLDEVGLAEDSPHMPLKALHPLLDEGTSGTNYKILTVILPEICFHFLFFVA